MFTKASIPNALTFARIGICPLLVPCYYIGGSLSSWALIILCLIAVATDFLDGFLARRWDVSSELGRALDPIGDKLLITVALMLLISDNTAHVIPAIAILFREIFVSGLRESLSTKQVIVHVSMLAKWKTASQMTAILLLFMAHDSDMALFYWLGNAVLWASAALTLYTGWEYARGAWEKLG